MPDRPSDPTEEQKAMEDARNALYPPPHNPQHVDVIDVARWDAFRDGWLAARASDAPPNEAVERAASAYKAVQYAAIGAAPVGMETRMAYYFYERVVDGRGRGKETHPPLPAPNFGVAGDSGDYPRIVARVILEAAAPSPNVGGPAMLGGEQAEARLQTVVDFLDAWRYCPVASSPKHPRQCLEDAAEQLFTALERQGGQ